MDEGKGSSLPRRSNERSLGWLAKSSVQPKKRKEIEGVSAASLVALKAQVAQIQQESSDIRVVSNIASSRFHNNKQPQRGKIKPLDGRNKGVSERAKRDREQRDDVNPLEKSRTALERKTKIYDLLSKRNASNGDATKCSIDDLDKYEVDFAKKLDSNYTEDRSPNDKDKNQLDHSFPIDTTHAAVYTYTGSMDTTDMKMERERRAWEESVKMSMAEEESKDAYTQNRHELIKEIEKETKAGRDRVNEIRQERQARENRRREKLKAVLLEKKLRALKE